MSKSYHEKRRKYRHNPLWIIPTVLGIVLCIFIGLFYKYEHEHFRPNTIIQGVDCSRLTVNEAFVTINEQLKNCNITYVLVDESFTVENNPYNIKLVETYELQAILNNQNTGDKTHHFTLSDIFIDDLKLKEFIQSLSCFQEENIRQPQNAYLELGDDNQFYIEPEILGNELDFDEALNFALSALKNGETNIDFREITNSTPEIVSTNKSLLTRKNEFNCILDSVVNYTLPDGSIFTLDAEIIKDWFYKDENNLYQIDLDTSLSAFIKHLSQRVNLNSSQIAFPATDLGNIMIALPNAYRAKIDFEAELSQLKAELGYTVNRTPIYSYTALSFEEHNSYVEIDTSRQTVWMYIDGICIVSTPCVTGNYPNHHTPSGIFSLTFKEENRYLRGYNDDGSRYQSYVNYWMPFNGGIGLHDATWRNKFGGQIYKGNGSHGCVNLPLEAAASIYKNITMDMPIVVYAS